MSWIDDLPRKNEVSINPIAVWKLIKKLKGKYDDYRKTRKDNYGRKD